MPIRYPIRIAAAATASIVSCAGQVTSGPSATPPNDGTISVERVVPSRHTDQAASAFIEAVCRTLSARGFTILSDPGHSAYIAELFFSRTEVGTGLAKVAKGTRAIVPGASAGVGANFKIPFSAKKSESVPLRRIQLELRIRKRGHDAIVWRGIALTVRAVGSEPGANEAIAANLSEAVLRNYPIKPQGTISVP